MRTSAGLISFKLGPKLTDTRIHLWRIPDLEDGAVGKPVRVASALKEEPVRTLVFGVIRAVPHPASRSDGWGRSRAWQHYK